MDLPFIGVEPLRQNRGLGAALLKAQLAKCDLDGLPSYLELTNSVGNRPLYERHGPRPLPRLSWVPVRRSFLCCANPAASHAWACAERVALQADSPFRVRATWLKGTAATLFYRRSGIRRFVSTTSASKTASKSSSSRLRRHSTRARKSASSDPTGPARRRCSG